MSKYSLNEVENILYHLNYRWKLQSLCLWKGLKTPFSPEKLYLGFEDFLNLETYGALFEGPFDTKEGKKLRYNFLEHYLQRELMPYEAELRTWMKGAAAHVSGKKIYFREIIPFCQKQSTREQRTILQKETGPLCKFLRPFALSFWEELIDTLTNTFGFEGYIEYCKAKKGIDYAAYYEQVKAILDDTKDLYFSMMEEWVRRRFQAQLKDLTRFDAIAILSMSEFDDLFPPTALEDLKGFFRSWTIDLDRSPFITIELDRSPEKNPQAICFVLSVPDEIYVIIKPQGGWLDLESLGHELGHGLFSANISESLPYSSREISMGNALSEAFAFLIQNITMSVPFMVRYLRVDEKIASMLHCYKVLRDLAVFRRYAARFLSEFDMIQSGDLGSGDRYAELMAYHTGFYYQPEACLLDLAPEFYSLDYVLAWIAEATMEHHLREMFGKEWIFSLDAVEVLKGWWSNGYQNELAGFMEQNELGMLSHEHILERWKQTLSE